MLGLYQGAAEAAAEASAEAGQAAAAIKAPSRVLTAARAAARASLEVSSIPPRPGAGAGEPAFAGQPGEQAGAVQNVLHRLGVTSPGLLHRAFDIDRASEQLIIEAAGQPGTHREPPSPVTPDRSNSGPALIHRSHDPGDLRAASPHHPAVGHQHEPPEPEL
jgi:hypothetical protein